MMVDKNIVTLEEDSDGNLILPLPEELIQTLGWEEGDELEFIEDEYSDALYIRLVD